MTQGRPSATGADVASAAPTQAEGEEGSGPGDWLARLVAAQRSVADAGPGPGEVCAALADAGHSVIHGHVVVSIFEDDRLVARATAGAGGGIRIGDVLTLDGTLVGLCARTGQTTLCVESERDPRNDVALSRRLGARSSVHVALRHAGMTFGVLSLISGEPGAFTAADANRVSMLGLVGGAAIAAAQAAETLAGERLQLTAATNLSGMGLWRWCAREGTLSWSSRMFEIAGVNTSVVPTLDLWMSLLHPDDRSLCDMVAHAGDGPEGRTELFRLRAPDGTWRELLGWSRPEMDGARLVSVFGATVDVTRQRTAEREVARMAVRDNLTGLANRRVVDERIRRAVVSLPSAREAAGAEALVPNVVSQGSHRGLAGIENVLPCVAVLLLDLDRFQLVNDTLGHQIGDRLLVEVARRLSDALEPVDGTDHATTVGRIGGDEFVVVLPWVAGTDAAVEVAEWLQDVVSAPMDLDEATAGLVTTASVGLTVATDPGQVVSELFREAELAMYESKRSGRGGITLFDDGMRAEALRRVDTELQLRMALDDGRLVAMYQPIVSLWHGANPTPAGDGVHVDDQGWVAGVEALARVRRPDGSLMQPSEFIEVAEETGLIVQVDRWMLQESVRQLKEWTLEGADTICASVNVSARTLSQLDFDRFALAVLRHHDIHPSRLLIELTEGSLVPGGSVAQDAMVRLKQAGIATVIDDFGTGYSSLAYLQQLPVSLVKIDRSFVSRLGSSLPASAMVRAIIDLAHAHGHAVTAEGVETEEQAEALRGMGCDNAQGWLFGRPQLP